MNQSPEPLNTNTHANHRFPTDPPDMFQVSDEFAVLPEGKTAATPILKKIFIWCLVGGVILGAVLSVGVVKLLKYWGLTDVPQQPQIEIPASER
ncbi:MAG: hypothetical protein SWY16_25890 [Cyanobacteriota bacterium]|nr:hypothetical protein [Cyanobacteriota bacterium]